MRVHARMGARHTRRESAACQIYDELLLAAQPSSNSTGMGGRRGASSSSSVPDGGPPRPVTGALPWLYYQPGSPYLTADDLDLSCVLACLCQPQRVRV